MPLDLLEFFPRPPRHLLLENPTRPIFTMHTPETRNMLKLCLPASLCALLLFGATAWGQSPAGRPTDTQSSNPAEPPEMPEPTVLESASFLITQDGLVIGDARYKIVRSNFSGLVFASGRQRYFSKHLLVEDFQAMRGRERKAMTTSRHMHHFEFKKSGSLAKYKGWTITEKNRKYVLLLPTKSGFTQRIEAIGKIRVTEFNVDSSSYPFDGAQIFLLRMVLRKMGDTGEPVLVLHPKSGATGSLSLKVGPDGAVTVGGAGAGWSILKDEEGHVRGYRFKDQLFQREVK